MSAALWLGRYERRGALKSNLKAGELTNQREIGNFAVCAWGHPA